jgi:hypothetical protein
LGTVAAKVGGCNPGLADVVANLYAIRAYAVQEGAIGNAGKTAFEDIVEVLAVSPCRSAALSQTRHGFPQDARKFLPLQVDAVFPRFIHGVVKISHYRPIGSLLRVIKKMDNNQTVKDEFPWSRRPSDRCQASPPEIHRTSCWSTQGGFPVVEFYR